MRKQISATTENIVADTDLKKSQKKGIDYDNDHKRFQKAIRDTLGIDPESSLGQTFAMAYMQDPQAFMENIKDILSTTGEYLVNGVQNGFGKPSDDPSNIGEDNSGVYTGVLGRMTGARNAYLGRHVLDSAINTFNPVGAGVR